MIALGKPKKGRPEGDEPETQDDPDASEEGLEAAADECADAILSGDKPQIVAALKNLCRMGKY